jgi:hypothetical protein
MANYYTTRFNPSRWPPDGGTVPPGVEWEEAELRDRGEACCAGACLTESVTERLEEAWAYRTRYRMTCPAHGDALRCVESRLDWISPNEYLLAQSNIPG